MTSISPYALPASGYTDPEAGMEESRFQSSARHSVSAGESSNIDLSITTREGDVVTLSSETFSGFDYLSYTRSGRVKNGNGEAFSHISYRSMTLASGSAFTFSVKGDLNAEELNDIEAIVKGIDGIIHEMSRGDMDEAVQKALSMNGYDTVSQFEADLTLTRSYRAETQFATETRQMKGSPKPASGDPIEKPGDDFFDKMVQLMEERGEPLQKKSLKPLGQLFDHHVYEHKKRWEDREALDIMHLADLIKEMKHQLEALFSVDALKSSAV